MKKHIHTLSAFLKSLCAACAFLALALLLCALTACSKPAGAEVSPSNPAPSLSELPSVSPSPMPPADPSSVPPAPASPDPSEESSPLQSALPSEVVPQPSATPSDIPTPEPSPESSAQPEQSNSENGFQAVLRGNAAFFSTDANQSLMVSELNQGFSEDSSITTNIEKFAVADLDGDGEQEAILWVVVNEFTAFFEILHQQNGQIYGYTLGYRAFGSLKEDGTFFFSSGAADSGFGWLSFSDMTYTTNRVTYSESGYDANNEFSVNFYVNGKPASESEFELAMEEQMGKDDMVWYDFTDENIALGLKDI